jgi:hypothetical protein
LKVKLLYPPGKGKDWRKARAFGVTERLQAYRRLTPAIPEAAASDRLERVDSTRSLALGLTHAVAVNTTTWSAISARWSAIPGTLVYGYR